MSTWTFAGRPFTWLDPVAPRYLVEARDLFECVENQLTTALVDILSPNPIRQTHRRSDITGRWQLVTVPGATPRESALAHATIICDLVDQAYGLLQQAAFSYRYRICSTARWGEPPENEIIGSRPQPCDFPYELQQAHTQLITLRHAVRRRIVLLRKCLDVIETHQVGETFKCKERKIIRALKPRMLLAYRDSTGNLWTLQDYETPATRTIT